MEAIFTKQSMYLLIMYNVYFAHQQAANREAKGNWAWPWPDIGVLQTQVQEAALRRLGFGHWCPPDADSGSDAIITQKKADKDKAKAIDQLEGDLNGGPATRVCYQLFTQSNNWFMPPALHSHKACREPSLGSHMPQLTHN